MNHGDQVTSPANPKSKAPAAREENSAKNDAVVESELEETNYDFLNKETISDDFILTYIKKKIASSLGMLYYCTHTHPLLMIYFPVPFGISIGIERNFPWKMLMQKLVDGKIFASGWPHDCGMPLDKSAGSTQGKGIQSLPQASRRRLAADLQDGKLVFCRRDDKDPISKRMFDSVTRCMRKSLTNPLIQTNNYTLSSKAHPLQLPRRRHIYTSILFRQRQILRS